MNLLSTWRFIPGLLQRLRRDPREHASCRAYERLLFRRLRPFEQNRHEVLLRDRRSSAPLVPRMGRLLPWVGRHNGGEGPHDGRETDDARGPGQGETEAERGQVPTLPWRAMARIGMP